MFFHAVIVFFSSLRGFYSLSVVKHTRVGTTYSEFQSYPCPRSAVALDSSHSLSVTWFAFSSVRWNNSTYLIRLF